MHRESASRPRAKSDKPPARKRARKALGTVASGSSASPPPGAPSVASDVSMRSEHLTLPELAAVAALAMHSNHERSLEHSANLDQRLLEAHSHPLHSAPAVSPTKAAVANDRVSSEPRQMSADLHNLVEVRRELHTECDQARETIRRLEKFLYRSETMLRSLDDRLGGRHHTSRVQNDNSPQKATGLHAHTPSSPGHIPSQAPALSVSLSAIPMMPAVPSDILRKRKLQSLHARGPRKLVWEICPSNALGITIVPIKAE